MWALGVTLVHMLTLKTPFANGGINIIDDRKAHQRFIEDPAKFLVEHGAVLEPKELHDMSYLLKHMLAFEKEQRYSIFDVVDSDYLNNHHKQVKAKDIRAFMRQKLIKPLPPDTIPFRLENFPELPPFVFFSWN